MSGECSVPDGPDDLKDMSDYSEEDLWQLINDNRHRISLSVRPCRLMPYLRQARVLTEVDEDEILSSHNLTNRTMRTSYMLDLLGTQGRNGAVALLEGLMIHYPTIYTQVTGRTPSTEPSRFSGLIKYSELTEYLIRAVTGMQKELQEARNEAGRHGARAASLESELGQLAEQEKESRDLQSDYERMRKHLAAAHRDVTKLKDEKCDVYVRYTAAIEEKSAVNIRNRDLSLQVYQLQTELQKAQTETDFQKRRSLRCASPAETQQLREEVSALRRQLLEAEKFSPAREDILAQDLAEAMDGRMELTEQLKCYREENEQLLREKEEILEQKERVSLQVEQLTLDCNMYKQKSTVIQAQMRELQAERDHAYVSRDEAQAQIARSLAEKDTLRAHLVELQERIFTLRSQQGTRRERRDTSGGRVVSWESSSSEDSPCTAAAPRLRLRRMPAINPASCDDAAPERIDSFHSYNAEPPCTQSLRRRDETLYEDSSLEMTDTESLLDDYVFLPDDYCKGLQRSKAYKALQRTASTNGSTKSICSTSPPPFLVRSRPRAIRASGRVLTISFQADTLLSQLTVVGGNKTGVFVHEVMEGSTAQGVGIRPGSQIVQVKCEQNQQSLSMVLVDSTLEEAMWALDQVRGFCHISLRPSQDAYETLLQQLQSTPTNSGDSFYVRVNVALPSGPGGTLAVCCNDILHVTNTQPAGTEDSWRASHVYPCQLLDLQSGTVPNYYRAQRLLIRAIEDMSFQLKMGHKTPEKQKAVRIVSTGRQGRNPLWMSVENCQTTSTEPGDASAPRGCVTLMPYTLVTPHFPPVCRPILLLPTTLGRILDKKMAEWQGFKLCEPEVLTPTEHAARLQRSEVLEECEQDGNQSYTLQSVEKVMKQGIHCVLPLGLDCVRRLHRAEIFPIIIFIAQTARSARKLRSKLLHRSGRTEEQLLACSQSEEPLLDKLPCLYRHVAPDSWCDTTALMTSLRTIIWEEQKKIVWVEPDLW